jgi:hypothetical protein
MKSGNLNFLEHFGPFQACKRDCATFTLQHVSQFFSVIVRQKLHYVFEKYAMEVGDDVWLKSPKFPTRGRLKRSCLNF